MELVVEVLVGLLRERRNSLLALLSKSTAHDHKGLIACCKRLGDSIQGGDSSLWADLLKYFGELGEDCSMEVKEVLSYIERDDILPPIVILQTLSRNPCLTLSVVKDYIARKLEQESKLIEEDRRAIEKYEEEEWTAEESLRTLRTLRCGGCPDCLLQTRSSLRVLQ